MTKDVNLLRTEPHKGIMLSLVEISHQPSNHILNGDT